MKILQIGADRSKRGILYEGTSAFKRQEAYAKEFGSLDIIGFSLRADGAKTIEAPPLRVIPTNSISKLLFGWDALRIARTLPRPDALSVQDPFETGLVGWLISWIKSVPLHVQVHTDFLSPAYARVSLLNRLRVLLAGFVLRRAARIRAVSERIRNSLKAGSWHLAADVTVLPIFVAVEKFRHPVSELEIAARFTTFKTKLLVVARLEPEKNVALAIRAYSEVSPPDACLIIVGEGSERASLEGLARDLGMSGHVFFEDGKDLASYYALADLVLVPSLYEGYGMVTIEALVAGKPVLSTDVGIAREAGAIVTTPATFADALAEWFKSGPRGGRLAGYPYNNFDEYVQAYCDDIERCAGGQ